MHVTEPCRDRDKHFNCWEKFPNKKEPPAFVCDCHFYFCENRGIKKFPPEHNVTTILTHRLVKKDISNSISNCTEQEGRNPSNSSLGYEISHRNVENLTGWKRNCSIGNHEEKNCSITSRKDQCLNIHSEFLLYQSFCVILRKGEISLVCEV